jgi:hypothetical protein
LSSPLPCYLIRLRPKYLPQHTILEQPEQHGQKISKYMICSVTRSTALTVERFFLLWKGLPVTYHEGMKKE